MSLVLGFRAEGTQVYCVVVAGTRRAPTLVAHEKLTAPVDVDEAHALAWYRNEVRRLVDTYAPAAAVVRFPEFSARGGNKEGARRRLRIEGVLLEASCAYGLPARGAVLANIGAKLGSKQAKKYLGSGDLRGLDLSPLPEYAREAALAAVTALPEG
jgi:hypothetical protein